MSDNFVSLITEIRKLIEKLDAPKKKDWSEKLGALTPFLATVVLAGVSLWLTSLNQQAAATHDKEFHDAQIRVAEQSARHDKAFHDAQVRVAELEAISRLIPALSSKDPVVRKRAEDLLEAVQQSKGSSATGGEAPVVNSTSKPTTTGRKENHDLTGQDPSVIDKFVAIVLNETSPPETRIDAAANIAKAVSAPNTPFKERRRAEQILSKVAGSPNSPSVVRSAAQFAIADIRHVDISQIKGLVQSEPNSRNISEVILHHTQTPNISSYKGYQTIAGIAKFKMETMKWNNPGFHYAVAPDGTVWIGAPLNSIASHVAGQNSTTVGVVLIMDGDSELPTPAQQGTLMELLKALFAKLNIKATNNFAEGHGFHRDYLTWDRQKTCPGMLMTKEKILSWFTESTASHN